MHQKALKLRLNSKKRKGVEGKNSLDPTVRQPANAMIEVYLALAFVGLAVVIY
jgi:hypothetical protein